MVIPIVLDGSSEIGAHVWLSVIWSAEYICLDREQSHICLFQKGLLNMLPSNISNIGYPRLSRMDIALLHNWEYKLFEEEKNNIFFHHFSARDYDLLST